MFIEKYFVTHYLVKYLNQNKEKCEIFVPNLHGRVLYRHDIKELAIKYIEKNTIINNPIFQSFEYYGNCAFCSEFNKLEKSHAIARTIFRTLLKKIGGGQPIVINGHVNKLEFDSDTWAIHQLCKKCESFFNREYEDYSIKALRGENLNVTIVKTINGVSFKGLDQEIIAKYCLSVYWRAALSVHPSYSSVHIFPEFNEYLKLYFKYNQILKKNVINIRMYNLVDENNTLNEDSIRSFIVGPFTRFDGESLIFCLKLENYFVEIKIKKLTFKEKFKRGYLGQNKNILFLENKDIFSIEELEKNFALGKYLNANIYL
ncbi:hypothetical protein [Acinetobacter guillouiae]|uniref:Uncharacterized protein n=1 Tax=Acinetobacter guillouiae NIPH 991 TaxID=1217656 RepID=N8WWY1_ACIGI|nr:hypothetical protein [Acinetobacter guillouiae]ENV16466.1 hypothetical protein F964_03401 [Acinetobacter guillouiae NIPH 991]